MDKEQFFPQCKVPKSQEPWDLCTWDVVQWSPLSLGLHSHCSLKPSHIADFHHPNGLYDQRFLFEPGEEVIMQKTLPDTCFWRVLLLYGR